VGKTIEYFRDRLLAPLEYDESRKGYYYTDLTFQLPVTPGIPNLFPAPGSRCQQRHIAGYCQPQLDST
jgi:hypothetical protein